METSTLKQPGCLSRARLCNSHILREGVVLDFAYLLDVPQPIQILSLQGHGPLYTAGTATLCWMTFLRSTCLAAPGLRYARDELRVREKSEKSAKATAAVICHVNDCESFRHCCNLNCMMLSNKSRSRQMQTANHCHIITEILVRCIRSAARRSRATAMQPHSTAATSGFLAAWMRSAHPLPRCTACGCRRQTPLHYQSVPYAGTNSDTFLL